MSHPRTPPAAGYTLPCILRNPARSGFPTAAPWARFSHSLSLLRAHPLSAPAIGTSTYVPPPAPPHPHPQPHSMPCGLQFAYLGRPILHPTPTGPGPGLPLMVYKRGEHLLMEGPEWRSQLSQHRAGGVKDRAMRWGCYSGEALGAGPGTNLSWDKFKTLRRCWEEKLHRCLWAAVAFDLAWGKSGVMSLHGYPGALGIPEGGKVSDSGTFAYKWSFSPCTRSQVFSARSHTPGWAPGTWSHCWVRESLLWGIRFDRVSGDWPDVAVARRERLRVTVVDSWGPWASW